MPVTRIHRRQITQQWFAASMGMVLASALMAGLPASAGARSLMGDRDQFIGNPQCTDWATMNAASRFEWTGIFLSVVSMGHAKRLKKGEQQYKNLEGVEEVVAAIDAHCAVNPQAQASEAAAAFLNP